jgi:hypothetical protein
MRHFARTLSDNNLKIGSTISLFYGYLVVFSIKWIQSKEKYLTLEYESCLWPLKLPLSIMSIEVFFYMITFLSIFCFIVTSLYRNILFLRIATFIVLFIMIAAENSFGKINHGYHPYIFISFFFIFISNKKNSVSISSYYRNISVFILAQSSFLLLYSISGFWKLFYGIRDLRWGNSNFLQKEGFSTLVVKRILQTESQPLLADFIIHEPWLGRLLFLCGILTETGAVFFILFSSLLPHLSVLFILLHLGNILLLGISFYQWIVLIVILFLTPGKIKNAITKFKNKKRWAKKRTGVFFKLFIIFFVFHFSASAYLIYNKKSEIFPIFTWNLFSRIPNKIRTDYACYYSTVEKSDKEYSLIRNDGSITSYTFLQNIGKGLEEGENVDELITLLLKHHIKSNIKSLRITKRRFDLFERYKNNTILNERTIFKKEIMSETK